MNDDFNGYIKIPGRNEEKQVNNYNYIFIFLNINKSYNYNIIFYFKEDRKSLISSSQFYDTYKYNTKSDKKKQSSIVTM